MAYKSTDALDRDHASGRWLLGRWLLSLATMNVPQAAGPVAFSLVALSLTRDASGGAAIILAMTLAQVVGAAPLTRLGKKLAAATYLRLLVAVRTLALASIALSAYCEARFIWLIPLAAIAGLVNAAAYGYLRSLLNHISPASQLPRALGIATTLNEMTYVVAPVMASGLGTVSPVFAIVALTLLGALPALLAPNTRSAAVEDMRHAEGSVISPAIAMWLLYDLAGAAAVAAIEIGAVALALKFGYRPGFAVLFTVPLCLASVTGGIWVSVRNRMAKRSNALVQLAIMMLGSALIALQLSIATAIVGTVLVGLMLAPLATYCGLVLETLVPAHKHPDIFALQRSAEATGVIIASAMLTLASLPVALTLGAGMMVSVTVMIAIASLKR